MQKNDVLDRSLIIQMAQECGIEQDIAKLEQFSTLVVAAVKWAHGIEDFEKGMLE
jgi:hypothetical protein